MSDKTAGLLAEFDTPSEIYSACEKVRDRGFTRWDAHTPFPVHGLDKAMGLKRSVLPYLVFVMGLTGAASAMLLQWWTSAIDYQVVIAAKPLFSWQAFIPVTFEVMVLFSAGTAVFGMLFLCRLPQWYHPTLKSERFRRASDDKFFISIEAQDPRFDESTTESFLKEIGAHAVERLEE